jgi:hypothetical protein
MPRLFFKLELGGVSQCAYHFDTEETAAAAAAAAAIASLAAAAIQLISYHAQV